MSGLPAEYIYAGKSNKKIKQEKRRYAAIKITRPWTGPDDKQKSVYKHRGRDKAAGSKQQGQASSPSIGFQAAGSKRRGQAADPSCEVKRQGPKAGSKGRVERQYKPSKNAALKYLGIKFPAGYRFVFRRSRRIRAFWCIQQGVKAARDAAGRH